MANRDDHAEAYRVFNMGMVVYTDRDNLEHALVHLESQTPKPIGEIKERGFVIVNGIKLL
jgi:phosphoribosylaminoimidazole (AIR) synthetase